MKEKRSLKIASVLALVIAFALAIIGSQALLWPGSREMTAIAHGLLIGNLLSSCLANVNVLKRK